MKTATDNWIEVDLKTLKINELFDEQKLVVSEELWLNAERLVKFYDTNLAGVFTQLAMAIHSTVGFEYDGNFPFEFVGAYTNDLTMKFIVQQVDENVIFLQY